MDIVYRTAEGNFNYRVAGIWIENKHVLLHKDVNDTNWALPGGRVGIGEDSLVALKREFLEELDAYVEVGSLRWVVENFFNYRETDFHEIGFYYEVTSSDKSIFQEESFHGPEGDRLLYKWVPLDQLSEYELLPDFLKSGLLQLPQNTVHLITRDEVGA